MSLLYQCESCGGVTDHPQWTEQRYPYGDSYVSEYFLAYCPCGGEMMEAQKCFYCGEVYIGTQEGICENCLKEQITPDNLRRYSVDWKGSDVQIPIPDYLYYIFGEDGIEDILIAELEKHFPRYEDEVAAYLAEEGTADYIEWLNQRNSSEEA